MNTAEVFDLKNIVDHARMNGKDKVFVEISVNVLAEMLEGQVRTLRNGDANWNRSHA